MRIKRRLKALLPAPQVLDPGREVIAMEKLLLEDVPKISVEVTGIPQEVNTSTMFWIHARINNGLDRALHAAPPYPVRLAYHWLEKDTRKAVVFDGLRSGFFPGLEAATRTQYVMTEGWILCDPDELAGVARCSRGGRPGLF